MSGKVSPAREIAMKAFVQVMENKKRPEDIMDGLCAEHKNLKKVDRAFAKEALFGSLRWYKKIFWILQNTSKRNLMDSPPEVRAALVIGTYQIFYMSKVPDRAAVNESVEFVKEAGHGKATSFANGILRQIARKSEYYTKPDKKKEPVKYLSLQFSHPEWIVNRWFDRYKFDSAQEMLLANNQPPPRTVRINSLKTEVSENHLFQGQILKEEKIQSERAPLRGCLFLKAAPPADSESLFGQGYFTIQDESSQLIGLLVAPQEGEAIVDTCCGPGGKLSHVYELGKGKIKLIGVEKNKHQMLRAKETMDRLGHDQVEWHEQDFFKFKPESAPDKILLDAPCSGLGVLRRHPEGKWHKNIQIIQRMADQQKQLIENSLGMLKVGGSLIYSVCSFEPEETSDQLKWIQRKFGDAVEVISPVAFLPDFYKRYVTRDNVLLVFSGNQSRADGFGAFIVKKTKEIEASELPKSAGNESSPIKASDKKAEGTKKSAVATKTIAKKATVKKAAATTKTPTKEVATKKATSKKATSKKATSKKKPTTKKTVAKK